MPDRERVITHLQIIRIWAKFARERDLQFFTAKHLEDIAQWAYDALELLKEQEAVKPSWNRGKPFCGVCGLRIHGGKFCSECGRPIAWEGR